MSSGSLTHSSSLDDMRSLASLNPEKRNAQLLKSITEIYSRDATTLPLDKDLPRLVGKIKVFAPGVDEPVTLHTDKLPSEEKPLAGVAVARLLTYLSEQLDSGDVAKDMQDSCEKHLLGEGGTGDTTTRTVQAIKDLLRDPKWVKLDTPSLSVVRALNQSIVAPPWSMLKLGFGEEVPFVNIHNSWQIEVRLPPEGSHTATVVHSMSQRVPQDNKPEEDALLFRWVLELDIDTSKAELVAVRFDLDDLRLDQSTSLQRARQFQQALHKYSFNSKGLEHPHGSLQTPKAYVTQAKRWATEHVSKRNVKVAAELLCAAGAVYVAAHVYNYN